MINNETIKVWDPLIRLFHWLLVCAFATAWFTQEQNYPLHLQAGYLTSGLIILRIIWGWTGSKFARFSNFIYSPAITLSYIRSLKSLQVQRYPGHNPAGGMMVILLMTGILIVTISGIALDAAENWSGPLAEFKLFHYRDLIQSIHVISTNTLLVFIALHIMGVLFHSLLHRENLVKAMITGKKRKI